MQWIIKTYGQLTNRELFNREQNLTAMTYDTMQPVDFIFNKTDTFCDLADLSGAPITVINASANAIMLLSRNQEHSMTV